MSANVYQIVNDRIIEQMQQGIIPWRKPWGGTSDHAISRSTGKPYSLINQFLLGKPGEYATFNQIKAAGGSVRKGEKASVVVFWKMQKVEETNTETGETKEKVFPVLRYYQVFNLDQCENISPKYYTETPEAHENPSEEAEAIIAEYVNRSGVKFTATKSDSAYYRPATDEVVVPQLNQYVDSAEYYSTAFHELTHSTGHKSRLDRFKPGTAAAAFGGEEYSREELVAELGSAYLMGACGINSNTTEKNSAAYLQSWMKALKNDPRMMVVAAGKAEKAADYILNK